MAIPLETILAPPLLTADLPGIGGKIKQQLEDFEVEELPAYEPCGQGDHLFLWIEKRDMGAEFFARQIARRLGISPGEIGTAGMKDRKAVTRQWVSLPASAEPQLGQLEGDGLRVLQVSRHGNKLRAGHLRGNRFRILIRDVGPAGLAKAQPILERIRQHGLLNYYGPQRFGRDGETWKLGLALFEGERGPRSGFLRKLALSAAQSGLYNHYLGNRLRDNLTRRILPGEVLMKRPHGGMFVAEDVEREQARFDAGETVHAGPMFGRKTFAAQGEAAQREGLVLEQAGLSPERFAAFGKLLQGTRRPNLVFPDELEAHEEADGVRLAFSLPAGSYATVLLRELMKVELSQSEESE
jgi:tRNA pseudouridine13 synthase